MARQGWLVYDILVGLDDPIREEDGIFASDEPYTDLEVYGIFSKEEDAERIRKEHRCKKKKVMIND